MNAYTVSAPDNITVFGDTRIRELERIVRNQSEEIILLKKKRDELNKSVEKVTTLQAQLVERDVEIHKLNLESLKEYKIRIEMSHKIETLETRNQSIDRFVGCRDSSDSSFILCRVLHTGFLLYCVGVKYTALA
jgi:hypothetical protein